MPGHPASTRPSSTRSLLIAFSLALAACSTTTAASKPASSPVSEEKAEQPQIAMGCIAGNANWTKGRYVDEALLAKARTDAAAAVVREVRIGHAYTMEYNGSRLNLHTDKNGIILDVTCG